VSVRLMFEIFQADLGSGPTPKLVLIALADFAADDGTSVYPSVKTIADKCDLSERATRYTLRKLQKAGLLEMEREASQHTSRRYLIHIEAVRGAKTPKSGCTRTVGQRHRSTSASARSVP